MASLMPCERAEAWCRMTTAAGRQTSTTPCVTEGIPLAWRRRCISYAIDRDGSMDLPFADLEAAIARSFATWESVTCNGSSPGIQIEELDKRSECKSPQFHRSGGNVNAVVFLLDWVARDYDPNAYALTVVWNNPKT